MTKHRFSSCQYMDGNNSTINHVRSFRVYSCTMLLWLLFSHHGSEVHKHFSRCVLVDFRLTYFQPGEPVCTTAREQQGGSCNTPQALRSKNIHYQQSILTPKRGFLSRRGKQQSRTWTYSQPKFRDERTLAARKTTHYRILLKS